MILDWLTGIELNFGYGDYLHSESHIEEHHEEEEEEEEHEPTKYLRRRLGSRHSSTSLAI